MTCRSLKGSGNHRDAKAELDHAYFPILKTDEVVWDVYMLFDRDAEWKDKPPAPVYIMDKIGLDVARPLDGAELANEILDFVIRASLPVDFR